MCLCVLMFFFFKQKTAYEMRISDWSSDVCSSDLASLAAAPLQCDPGTCHSYQNVAFDAASEILGAAAGELFADAVEARFFRPLSMVSAGYGMARLTGARDWAKNGRASCRERGVQYV